MALATSVFLGPVRVAAAAPVDAAFETPWKLYEAGQGLTVRRGLEAALASPAAQPPAVRAPMLALLLEICRHGQDLDCVRAHAPAYAAAAAAAAPDAAPVLQARRQREADFFAELARWSGGEAPAAVLAARPAVQENAADGELYLRRQLLTARLRWAAGDAAGFSAAMDRALSLLATLDAPQDARRTVAYGLVEALDLLARAGQTERAFGLYRAAGPQLAAAFDPAGFDAVVYRLTEAQILQQMGDAAGAARALDAAIAPLRRLEMDEARRRLLLGEAQTLRAALALASGDTEAAAALLADHPFRAGPPPAEDEAVTAYAAVRLLLARSSGQADPEAAGLLRRHPGRGAAGETAAIYRAAGLLLAAEPNARAAAATDLARRIRAQADRPGAGWSHPGVVERLLLGAVLADGGAALPPALAFDLFQLAGRSGGVYDADALSRLGRAGDEAQRRAIHQVLRLEARRDRLLREQVQKVVGGLGAAPTAALALRHNVNDRRRIADFDRRIAEAEQRLAAAGLGAGGAQLATLAALQDSLRPGEAALQTLPVLGGRAYLCVRRDSVLRLAAPSDEARLKLDGRLLHQALSASHAASEALDSQYPAAAAVRLYDSLLRPFSPCLKPGDEIAWLGNPAGATPPLAALLTAAPPKRGDGWDLAAADWVVRQHATAYAGSAAALVAARTGPRRTAADFDFLGVGDPVLAGAKAAAAESLAALPPLPETRPELEASARGFAAARLLTGGAASERALRRELVGHYRFLSFATHGLMRQDLQGLAEPALVLTPVRPDDPWDDGLLTAEEVADLDLRAAFVALSACNTANADPQTLGADLPALTSAFAVAGAPAVLATLWPVDSQTGQRVVAGAFDRLKRGDVGPGAALAEAQRAFLAAPPSRAYLHPRFWAPFVIAGDGAAAAAPAPRGLTVTATAAVTRESGEVLALQPVAGGLAMRFVDDADAAGRHPAGLAVLGQGGAAAWRRAEAGQGASPVLARLGEALLTAGSALAANGRYAPVLDLTAAADGGPVRRWTGEGLSDAFVLAGTAWGADHAAVAVGEMDLRAGGGHGRLRVLAVDAALAPRPLFEVEVPAGARLVGATLTPLGTRLLASVTWAAAPPSMTARLDDYDQPACPGLRTTRVELREADGRLVAAQTLEGFTAAAAQAAGAPGRERALLGGSRRAACSLDGQAEVVALDGRLTPTTLWRDETLGDSEVRALQAAPGGSAFDGGVWLAAWKAAVVDVRPVGEALGRRADPYALRPTGVGHGVLLVRLDGAGRAEPVKRIDAASDLLPDALVWTAKGTPDAGELVMGGALGGRAALVRLAP